jgi:hypothetical protein
MVVHKNQMQTHEFEPLSLQYSNVNFNHILQILIYGFTPIPKKQNKN